MEFERVAEIESPLGTSATITFLQDGAVLRFILGFLSILAIARSYWLAYNIKISAAWMDFWFWVANFQRWADHTFTLSDLMRQMHEHRIVTTQLILLFDSLLFDMTARSVPIFNFLALLLMGLTLATIVRFDRKGGSVTRWPALYWIALAAAACQNENFALPIAVMIAIFCATGAAAAYVLAKAAAENRKALAAGAGLLAIIADFTQASGVLVTPALFVLLLLMRAGRSIWAVFTPLAAVGAALFLFRYSLGAYPDLHLVDWYFTWVRIVYIANFYGDAFFGLPAFTAVLGFSIAALFLIACTSLLRQHTMRGQPFPAGDAALVAIGLSIAICGPAGAVTPRILMGPTAALTPRYATDSLLFIMAVLGLYIRWADHASPQWVRRFVLPTVGALLLVTTNLPRYDGMGDHVYRVITADAQLWVNDVGVEGPASGAFADKPAERRDLIAFLHQRRLNVFSPGENPPADLLEKLQRANRAELPACRGFIDRVYAIDASAFMIGGWVTDPAGRHTPPWIAALDANGEILGTMRPLTKRPDVQAAMGLSKIADGFDGGFRFRSPAISDEPRSAEIIGIFPKEHQEFCRLAAKAGSGPMMIVPATELQDLTMASATAQAAGLRLWQTGERPLGTAPADGQVWSASSGDTTPAEPVLRFHVDQPLAADRVLAIPFAMQSEAPNRRIVATMGDGARFEIALPSIWERPDWRAVVIPAELLARHRGAQMIEVYGGIGERWLAVAAPVSASVPAEWSRLF